MTLSIAPSVAEKAELDALVEAQQNPKSAQYHQWLTQEEYGARFGLTEADLRQVTGWLETQGFTVKNVAPSRNLITFSGTVAQSILIGVGNEYVSH
jgi:subtilase family serine protease